MIDLIGRSIAAPQLKFYRPEIQGPFGMGYRERGCHARGVHGTQDTSRIGTVRVKNNSGRVVRNMKERNMGTNKKSPKQDLDEYKKRIVKI